MHRDEAGERGGDEGAERKRGPRAKMSKTAEDGEESRRVVQSSRGRGGMTAMGGGCKRNAVFSFFC